MKFNLINVTTFGVGCILIWAALKDQDPRTLIQNALQGKATQTEEKDDGKSWNKTPRKSDPVIPFQPPKTNPGAV